MGQAELSAHVDTNVQFYLKEKKTFSNKSKSPARKYNKYRRCISYSGGTNVRMHLSGIPWPMKCSSFD